MTELADCSDYRPSRQPWHRGGVPKGGKWKGELDRWDGTSTGKAFNAKLTLQEPVT